MSGGYKRAKRSTALQDFTQAVRKINEGLAHYPPKERKLRLTLFSLWWFVENIEEQDTARTTLFFKLRAMVRELQEEVTK